MRFKNYLVYSTIVIIVILVIIFGQQKAKHNEKPEGEIESSASGFLDIQTVPKGAEIFLDGQSVGKSPASLSNVPAGQHSIALKKESYANFETKINIEAGKRANVDATLILISIKEQPKSVEEQVEILNESRKNANASLRDSGIIDLDKNFLIYYDFSEKQFTTQRPADFDMLSKRFNTVLTFIGSSPASIRAISKSIEDIKKEDCADIKGSYNDLHSGQSLCFITKEGIVGAIGGEWQNTENAKLMWKMLES